jgi:uncharacterized repeat protein (TIGR01451 family)
MARITGIVVLLVSLLGTAVAPIVAAQEESGSVIIALTDEAGSPIGGGCFDVTDASGATSSVCDDDGDGIATLTQLPAGAVSVAQVSGPEGYELTTPQSGTIDAGVDTGIRLVARAIVIETPTEEPEMPTATAEPTEEPTVAPTDVPAEEPATPAPVDPTAMATEEPLVIPSPIATKTTRDSGPITLAATGSLGLQIVLTWGSDFTTVLLPGETVPVGTTVRVGVRYTATGAAPQGYIHFRVYKTANCSDAPVEFDASISPEGNLPFFNAQVPASSAVAFTAGFDGDSNYGSDATTCQDGLLAIGATVGPQHQVELHDSTFGPVIPAGSTRTYGAGFAITDRITGLQQAPGGGWGTLSIRFYRGSDCSGGEVSRSDIVLSNVSAQGVAYIGLQGFTAVSAGTYGFRAVYYDSSGTNAPSVSGCDQYITIAKQQPTLTLTLIPSATISLGESAAGKATLTAAPTPGGLVAYRLYLSADCSTPVQTTLGPYSLANGVPPQSALMGFGAAGTYSWKAEYFGDGNHEPATSACVAIEVRAPSLTLSLTTTDADITNGESINYTIVLTNTGAGAALEPTITDALPAGFNWSVSGSSAGVNCAPIGGDRTVNCTASRLDPGASITVTLAGSPTNTVCGMRTNQASAAATNHNRVFSSSLIVTVRCGDLVITKEKTSGTATPASYLVFQIQAKNTGDATLSGVVVNDDLVAGVPGQAWSIVTASSSPGCSFSAGKLRCEWGTLDPNATKTVVIRAFLTSNGCGSWTNTATGTATNEPAAMVANNTSTVPITVLCSDVALSKTPLNATIAAGDEIGFKLTVTNIGGASAEAVTIIDTLPASLTWQVNDSACRIMNGVLQCDYSSIGVGQSRSVTIKATTPTTLCATTIINSASVRAQEEDPRKLDNNNSTASVRVGCPDIQVSNVASPSSVSPGGTMTFTFTVTNIGEGAARGVKLMSGLPYGINWSAESAGCAVYPGAIGCDFASIGAGESRIVTITGVIPTGMCGTLGAYAFAWADNEQPSLTLNNMVYSESVIRCS